ncbi:hypothetical protein EMPG_15537 [Blastomyces silverae]|uniref:Uncharacterized protein n=1 Tax=Blastomyces silverae TaxID=2060906 RepID=A0A0H1BCF6_9EURO|nr:hypothetical protein EMPG_15537 [Blastomyces silverae]
MADIRALLRNELASRRATDSSSPSTSRPTKKRKLEPEQRVGVRKRSKATPEQILQEEGRRRDQLDEYDGHDNAAVPDPSIIAETTQLEQEEEEKEEVEDEEEEHPLPSQSSPHPTTPTFPPQQAQPQAQPQPQSINEDEWAAFEREVAAPTKMIPTAPPAALMPGHATISAAPLSAAELAEREKLDKQAQLRMREQEMSFEKEDAARLLEEEFEEMDQLEERVKRLKEMRDEIRRKREGAGAGAGVGEGEGAREEREGQGEGGREGDREDEDEDEDEEDDEGWDNWRFR